MQGNYDEWEPPALLHTLKPLAARARSQRFKSHCIHGHAYTPENTARRPGGRYCKECNRIKKREYDQRRKSR